MPKLDEATVRLARALERLEGVLTRPGGRAEARPAAPAARGKQGDLFAADERDAMRKELAAAVAERDAVAKELAAAQQENTRLQGLTAELSSGLDQAIDELKTVLDE